FPKNLGEILVKFDKVLVPELNLGQLLSIIRSKYLIDAKGYNKIKGKPFTSLEILNKIKKYLKE
ncbi:MAG: 2-oxoglutarate ferredoxin oxidoreductase subunit alpha, partial [Candidatus Neomarinimicrobiota bacterium]|nr:2-oxoglutarate ferredoxin oxidoreductase subunit alpha [Candidatus Neomarinimicrobiota bacterium]